MHPTVQQAQHTNIQINCILLIKKYHIACSPLLREPRFKSPVAHCFNYQIIIIIIIIFKSNQINCILGEKKP